MKTLSKKQKQLINVGFGINLIQILQLKNIFLQELNHVHNWTFIPEDWKPSNNYFQNKDTNDHIMFFYN